MKPRDHVIAGAIGAAALYPFIGKDSVVFFAASILIDLDHYLDFLWHNRFTDFSVRRMFAYHDWLGKNLYRPGFLNLEIFHTAEFLIPLFLISHWTGSAALFAVWLGFVFHVVLDIVNLAAHGVPFLRAHSFVEFFIRKRRLERKGFDPVGLCREALRNI